MLAPRSFAPRVAKPKSDPRFVAVTNQAKAAAHKLKQHPTAATKAKQASKSAKPPANERLATAKAKVVDAVKEAPAPKPQPTSFKALLRAEIDKAMPKTLGDTEQFMQGGAQGQLKAAGSGGVAQQKEAATGPADKAVKKPPDAGAVPEQPSAPLPAEPTAAAPPIAGDKAMPPPATPQEVSLQETKKDTDQALKDEKVKPESLAKANDPRFSAVADAKGKVAAQADKAPAGFRAKEAAVLAKAGAQAAGSARTGGLLMAGRKGAGNAKVLTRQQQQAAKEEAERAKVAATVEGIYARTKAKVEAKLGGLDGEVSAIFDPGVDAAIAQMKAFVDNKLFDYKLRRYLSIPLVGLARWLQDAALGLPDEVNVFYTQGRAVFTKAMDALIDRVAALVEKRLAEAKAEVAAGQAEIKAYVASLPANLQAAGKAAESAVNDRFKELEESIESKKNEIAAGLAQKYKEAFDKADDALKQMQEENKGLVAGFLAKLGEIVKALMEFKAKLLGLLKKGMETIQLILDDPIGFLGNLIAAVKGGFNAFVGNIWTHLKAGFFKWLLGSLAAAGITPPSDMSPMSVFKLVLDVLGITYPKLRAKAVKLVGETAVTVVEKLAEYVQALFTGGVAKLWEQVKADLSSLKDMVIGAIQDWLIETVVKQAVVKVVSMFNPAGAIVQAIIAIYNVVMFVIEKAQQIMALVEAVINSVHAIATGAIGGAIAWIEKSLAAAIPVVIGFLARLLGLSGITEKIQAFIKKVQSKVDAAIDKVIGKIVGVLKKAFGAIKAGAKKVLGWWKKKLAIGGGHNLMFEGRGKSARLVIRSAPQKPSDFLADQADERGVKDPKKKAGVAGVLPLEAKVKASQDILAKIDDDPNKTRDLAAGGQQAAAADAEMVKLDASLGEVQGYVGKTLGGWGANDDALPSGRWFSISRPSFTVTQKANIAKQHEATNKRLKAAGKAAPDLLRNNSEGQRINMAAGQARRHVVSSDDMAKHYEEALRSRSAAKKDALRGSAARLLIEQRGSVAESRVAVAGTKKENIQAAAIARHGAFFGYAKNFFIGDSKENSSIQQHLDDGHPEMGAAALKNHVRLMKRAWALDGSFSETPVK
ncbi:phage tail protein [Roseateles sp. LYH14W]|uniref:Uncharacterized protein n=1 Tax=Pelomonas parva TaxID=3299032 RepID=A0ABW7EW86_9BURK